MPNEPQHFQRNQELCQAVQKYCGYNETTRSYYSQQCDPQDAEEIVQTYGYPINKWNISNVHGFSFSFRQAHTLNEDISSWNVSNATTLQGMFYRAEAFNQDLSSWDVSNVTEMSGMFDRAFVFKKDIYNWDVSNVTDT
jgi:surface protein